MEKKDKLKACSDWIVLEESGRYLGEIGTDNLKYSEACELAQTLVHRYNSHAGLVEDKKKLVEALEKIEGTTRCGDDCGQTCYCGEESCIDKLVGIAKEALAAVKEGK